MMPLQRRCFRRSNLSPSDGYSRTVHYDSTDDLSVLFQCYGSVWPKVLPHCIANSIITWIIIHLMQSYGIDLTMTEQGHEYMSVLVGFLVVSIRCSFNLSLYFELRGHLSDIYMTTRDLVQDACALTRYDTNDEARAWRSDVAFQAMLLLRVIAAVLVRGTSGVNAWECSAFEEREWEKVRRVPSIDGSCGLRKGDVHRHEWVYGLESEYDENLLVPVRVVHQLKRTIVSQRVLLKNKLDSFQETKLLNSSGELMKAYHGIRRYLTTPFPFAHVQMTRTLLYLYIYSLPFALLNEDSKLQQNVVIVFIITFGYVGLEAVSIALDDPFGDDPVDLPVIGETQSVFEDVLLSICDVDGEETAIRLQTKMTGTSRAREHFKGLDNAENSALLSH